MRRALLRGGMVTLVIVGLASCGGDDDDSTDDADDQEEGDGANGDGAGAAEGSADDYVTAVADVLSDPEDGLGVNAEGATCMGEVLVDAVGLDALHDAGVSPEELANQDDLASLGLDTSEATVSELATGFAGCDVVTQIEGALLGPELTDRSSCIADAIDDSTFAQAMAQSFVDVEAGANLISEVVEPALAECPAELTDLVFRAFASDPAAEPTPEVRGCVEGYVADHAAQAAEVVTIGDEAAITALVDEITALCPGF